MHGSCGRPPLRHSRRGKTGAPARTAPHRHARGGRGGRRPPPLKPWWPSPARVCRRRGCDTSDSTARKNSRAGSPPPQRSSTSGPHGVRRASRNSSNSPPITTHSKTAASGYSRFRSMASPKAARREIPPPWPRDWHLRFECARATASLARRIEKLRSTAWGVKWPLPVPASLLLDSDGRLIAMYLGPVRPAQVLADARRQSLDPMAFHDASFPFPGPWIERPNRPIPLALALDLMDEGALDDAREFVARVGSTSRSIANSPSSWPGSAMA